MQIFGLGASVRVHLEGPRADELKAALTVAWSRCLGQKGTVPIPSQPRDELGTVPISSQDAPLDAGHLRLRLDDPGTVPIPSQPRDELGTVPISSRDATHLASDDLATLLSSATQAITHALLAAQVGRLLLFHAGAVAHPKTGQTLVFVAEGGTGKTTLARTLGLHYGYLTDESVGIDGGNRVLPYPKPLSLRTSPGQPKQEVSPDALSLLESQAGPTVAKIILLAREHRLTSPIITELPLLDAITALAPQSSSLYRLPKGLHRCAELIEATGGVLEVRYAEADELLPLAADLIGAP